MARYIDAVPIMSYDSKVLTTKLVTGVAAGWGTYASVTAMAHLWLVDEITDQVGIAGLTAADLIVTGGLCTAAIATAGTVYTVGKMMCRATDVLTDFENGVVVDLNSSWGEFESRQNAVPGRRAAPNKHTDMKIRRPIYSEEAQRHRRVREFKIKRIRKTWRMLRERVMTGASGIGVYTNVTGSGKTAPQYDKEYREDWSDEPYPQCLNTRVVSTYYEQGRPRYGHELNYTMQNIPSAEKEELTPMDLGGLSKAQKLAAKRTSIVREHYGSRERNWKPKEKQRVYHRIWIPGNDLGVDDPSPYDNRPGNTAQDLFEELVGFCNCTGRPKVASTGTNPHSGCAVIRFPASEQSMVSTAEEQHPEGQEPGLFLDTCLGQYACGHNPTGNSIEERKNSAFQHQWCGRLQRMRGLAGWYNYVKLYKADWIPRHTLRMFHEGTPDKPIASETMYPLLTPGYSGDTGCGYDRVSDPEPLPLMPIPEDTHRYRQGSAFNVLHPLDDVAPLPEFTEGNQWDNAMFVWTNGWLGRSFEEVTKTQEANRLHDRALIPLVNEVYDMSYDVIGNKNTLATGADSTIHYLNTVVKAQAKDPDLDLDTQTRNAIHNEVVSRLIIQNGEDALLQDMLRLRKDRINDGKSHSGCSPL